VEALRSFAHSREGTKVEVTPEVTFKGLDKSPSLEALIQERIAALEQIYPRIVSCRVVVEVPHRASKNIKVPIGVSVEVEVPGRPKIVAKDIQERREAKEDQTAALTHAFDAVERQLDRLADLRGGRAVTGGASSQSALVVRLFPDQDYGFVQVDNSPELHFTRNAVAGGAFEDLEIGMLVQVTRATEDGPMGPQARSVRLLDKARTPG
jgi:ribosome-associated translation inhibitor RaiA